MYNCEKTLITTYTKYTYLYYMISISFYICMCNTNSVGCIELLRKFCAYDEICAKILYWEKELISLKNKTQLGQILCVDIRVVFSGLVTIIVVI